MGRGRVVTLVGKPGCHLCDDARSLVSDVIEQLRERGTLVDLEELNILENDDLRQQYAEEIPVVLVDGAMHAFWRVDPDRLRRSLE